MEINLKTGTSFILSTHDQKVIDFDQLIKLVSCRRPMIFRLKLKTSSATLAQPDQRVYHRHRDDRHDLYGEHVPQLDAAGQNPAKEWNLVWRDVPCHCFDPLPLWTRASLFRMSCGRNRKVEAVLILFLLVIYPGGRMILHGRASRQTRHC